MFWMRRGERGNVIEAVSNGVTEPLSKENGKPRFPCDDCYSGAKARPNGGRRMLPLVDSWSSASRGRGGGGNLQFSQEMR